MSTTADRPLHLSADVFGDIVVCGLKKKDAMPYCGPLLAARHRANCEPHVCLACFEPEPPAQAELFGAV